MLKNVWKKEQAMMMHAEPSRRTEGLGIRRMNNEGKFNRGRGQGRRNGGQFRNGPDVCYTCGDTSHFSISTPRKHNLHADCCVLGIPIYVGSTVYPTDLLVVPLGQHEVILGMDWLSRYYAQLDCGRGRITL